MKPRATKYTVKHLGLTATRTSPRNYTHVIVGRWAPSDAVIEKNARYSADMAAKNYDYFVACVAAGVGGLRPDSQWPVAPSEFAKASGVIAANPDRAAYIQAEAERTRAKMTAERAASRPAVLQWSMSEKAARGAVGSWTKRCYVDVFVALTDQARGDAHGVSL